MYLLYVDVVWAPDHGKQPSDTRVGPCQDLVDACATAARYREMDWVSEVRLSFVLAERSTLRPRFQIHADDGMIVAE